jgi:hypothetical protein
VEVALQGSIIVYVAGTGENTGPNGIGGNTAIAVDHNFRDDFLLAEPYLTQKEQTQQAAQHSAAMPNPRAEK